MCSTTFFDCITAPEHLHTDLRVRSTFVCYFRNCPISKYSTVFRKLPYIDFESLTVSKKSDGLPIYINVFPVRQIFKERERVIPAVEAVHTYYKTGSPVHGYVCNRPAALRPPHPPPPPPPPPHTIHAQCHIICSHKLPDWF